MFKYLNFGDIYLTRNHKRAMFIKKRYDNKLEFIIEGNDIPSNYFLNGQINLKEQNDFDIVSKLVITPESVKEYAQEIGTVESEKFYEATQKLFDKMTDKEKQEFSNQYISIGSFSETIAMYVAKFIEFGYNKAIEDGLRKS